MGGYAHLLLTKPTAWLEVSACEDTGNASIVKESLLLQVPVLSEALVAAQGASAGKGNAGVWEFSRRLDEQELQDVRKSITFSSTSEDDRSTVQSVNLSYNDHCYTIRLFIEKSRAPAERDL